MATAAATYTPARTRTRTPTPTLALTLTLARTLILTPTPTQVDDPGAKRELRVGVGDALLQEEFRQVPRADVARVSCAALTSPEAAKVCCVVAVVVRVAV